MKVLIAEYTMFHEPSLSPEGKAMVSALKKSFENCGLTVVLPDASSDFNMEIERLARDCDYGIVIAPDAMLSKFSFTMDRNTHNIGSESMPVAVCANKRLTSKLLANVGIHVPREVDASYAGKRIIKPIIGEGSQGVRIAADGEEPKEGEMSIEYIEGEHFSVSIVGSRVIGEACGYYSGLPPVVLAVNRQFSHPDASGKFVYEGGETPVHPAKEEEMIEVAKKTIETLGCQGYTGVDMVVGDEIYVVDVNTRPTMSLVGIVNVIEEEIADVLLKATVGLPPECVHYNGKKAVFDAEGKVTVT